MTKKQAVEALAAAIEQLTTARTEARRRHIANEAYRALTALLLDADTVRTPAEPSSS